LARARRTAAPAPSEPQPEPPRISHVTLARARARGPALTYDEIKRDPFAVPEHPPGVAPAARLAQDEESFAGSLVPGALAWAASNQISSAFAEGTAFLGYPYLSVLAQRAEYRVVTETIAGEMTREWIEFESVSTDDDKTDRIKELEDAQKAYDVQKAFRKGAEGDGFFGRGHIYLDTGDTDDRDELRLPIGNGRNRMSRAKIGKSKLKALRPVEAVWCYPTSYNSNDPLSDDWFRPNTWNCMGKELHRTRLLTLVGREVPDLLKPAYSFGGLSLSQMIKPYVDNWLRTRQSVSDLIASFSVMGIKTDLAANLSAAGDALFERIELFTTLRRNSGTMVLQNGDAGTAEEFFNVSTPLGTLDHLQAQAQEHMAAVSRIPLVKLLGITPSGLNATDEGQIRSFYDWIAAYQEMLFRKPLTTVLDFIQLSLWGEVDRDITFKFKPLWQLDEAGAAAVEKTKADIHDSYLGMGVVQPKTVAKVLAADPESLYAGLDLEEEMPEPPAAFAEGGGEPPAPGAEGEEQPGKPHDPSNRFASAVTNRAANVAGSAGEGFGGKDRLLEAAE
jgi:phage-related protein (TIGR01555 family)